MKNKNLKEYAYKDVSMLLAAKIIAFNFRDNIPELSKVNSEWDEAYANNFIARIEDAINNHLGYDTKKQLRDATFTLKGIMYDVKNDIFVFKRLVRKFYKNEPDKRDEILNVLGFKQYSKEGIIGTQIGLIKLLFTFKTNLTDVLNQELVNKGIFKSLINNISVNADKLENMNNMQEILKGTTSEKTNSRRALYNELYREVSAICVVAFTHFKASKVKQSMFNFSKIAGSTHRNTKTELDNNIAADEQSNL